MTETERLLNLLNALQRTNKSDRAADLCVRAFPNNREAALLAILQWNVSLVGRFNPSFLACDVRCAYERA